MLPLRTVHFEHSSTHQKKYPYRLPIFNHLKELEFTVPVTMFVGDNGTGK